MTFIERLAELAAAGRPFVAVTLVGSHGSVPQEVGSKMLVDRGGLVHGTVGGGRVEAAAIEHAQGMLFRAPASAPNTDLLQWSLKRDLGMSCGGGVTLFFEALNHRVWSVFIFGAGHVAAALTQCLAALDCHLTVIDSRPEWLERLPGGNSVKRLCLADPVLVVPELPEDAYVLLMTMGHRTDRPVLEAILRSNKKLPYLGVIGSRGKRAALRKELIAAGIPEEAADAFRCPIGLPIGTDEPPEIAISVAAELLQVRGTAFRHSQ